MHPRTYSRTAPVLLASSLALAACGGGQSDEDRAATGATLATTAPETTAEPVEPSIVDDDADRDADSDADTTTTAPAVAADPPVNLFPDINVLDVYNGGEVNLAEALPGGDKAVLLWFWAPH